MAAAEVCFTDSVSAHWLIHQAFLHRHRVLK